MSRVQETYTDAFLPHGERPPSDTQNNVLEEGRSLEGNNGAVVQGGTTPVWVLNGQFNNYIILDELDENSNLICHKVFLYVQHLKQLYSILH